MDVEIRVYAILALDRIPMCIEFKPYKVTLIADLRQGSTCRCPSFTTKGLRYMLAQHCPKVLSNHFGTALRGRGDSNMPGEERHDGDDYDDVEVETDDESMSVSTYSEIDVIIACDNLHIVGYIYVCGCGF